ncbi:MAG: DUF262 domain-containing protein [Oceanicaulis sp.]
MMSPLNASASSAGALFSKSRFVIPPFQREYSWGKEQVEDFWGDIRGALSGEHYFLGLVILTEEEHGLLVVDGQQRLITLTLLAVALREAAFALGRKALAERIDSDFIHDIDYGTDERCARVELSDADDNFTLQNIINAKSSETYSEDYGSEDASLSQKISATYETIRGLLNKDISADPFRSLGRWAEFITSQLYFAVFTHPDASSAYSVFEVINTRGKDLTTADLLKNYIISQVEKRKRTDVYERWRTLAKRFENYGGGSGFVQFIRYVVVSQTGYVLTKDLFDKLASRRSYSGKVSYSPEGLIRALEENIDHYMQMVDPTNPGPADDEVLKIYSALNALNVATLRPVLLSLANASDRLQGYQYVNQLVARRIVVGNLGTGNVERRFGEVAKKIFDTRDWGALRAGLGDLNPSREEFVSQLSKRSLNKNTLLFVKSSVLEGSQTPNRLGSIHFIWPKNFETWPGFDEEDVWWHSTIGNTFIAEIDRRPPDANENWVRFKETLLARGIASEDIEYLQAIGEWTADSIRSYGAQLAERAANVWYPR